MSENPFKDVPDMKIGEFFSSISKHLNPAGVKLFFRNVPDWYYHKYIVTGSPRPIFHVIAIGMVIGYWHKKPHIDHSIENGARVRKHHTFK